MPNRPGVDDNPALQDLIGIWVAGAEELESRAVSVLGEIEGLLLNPGDGIRLDRLQRQVARIENLQEVAFAVADDAAQATQTWLGDEFASGGLAEVYGSGATRAGATFAFSAPHRAAVEVLAQDTFDDVLSATSFVDADAKRFVRRTSRMITGFKLTGGETAQQAGRRFAREMRTEFTQRGIGSVQYADGSRRSFGHYGEMLLRTKTGVAYNAGTVNHARVLGIKYFEILDGALCGLTQHNDPQLANNLIVTAETAQAWPLSHPNCRRAINPRPDLNDRNVGEAVSVQSPEARADQTAFEEALRQQQAARRARGRQSRSTRAPRPSRARPARNARPARQRPSRARREAAAGNARRRAGIEQARQEFLDQQRAALAGQRIEAVGTSGRAPAELLAEYGVTEAQWLNGRALATEIKRDVRATAKAEADRLSAWLQDSSLDKITRPSRLQRQREAVSGQTRFVRSESGYDFLEQLDDAAAARVRARMVDQDLFPPDVLGDQVRRVTQLDLSDDEAMDWLVDRWLHEDGLRSLASGRVPRYADVNDLIPADYDAAGYDLQALFGRELDEAAAHVAQVQATEAQRFAQRVLSDRHGTGPWEMDFNDYVRELEELETVVANSTTASGGIPEPVRLRLGELAPTDLDPDGGLSPADLFEAIRITAQQAGYLQ